MNDVIGFGGDVPPLKIIYSPKDGNANSCLSDQQTQKPFSMIAFDIPSCAAVS